MYECVSNVMREIRVRIIVQVMIVYTLYIVHTYEHYTLPPGNKTALVASFACACVRLRLFRFVFVCRLGVDVVVRSMLLKRNGTGILKSRGFEVVSIPRRNC